MAKEDVVSAGVKAVQDGEAQVIAEQLGVAYDAGVSSVVPSSGGLSQADVDAAVAAAKSADAQAISDAQAAASVAVGQAGDAIAALSAEQSVVSGLQASLADLDAKVQAILGALAPKA